MKKKVYNDITKYSITSSGYNNIHIILALSCSLHICHSKIVMKYQNFWHIVRLGIDLGTSNYLGPRWRHALYPRGMKESCFSHQGDTTPSITSVENDISVKSHISYVTKSQSLDSNIKYFSVSFFSLFILKNLPEVDAPSTYCTWRLHIPLSN